MAKIEHFTAEEIPYEILITENAEGQLIQSFARISLVRLADDTIDVCFAPKWVDEDLEEFSIAQQELLKAGNVTVADMNGKGRCFVQFDEAINQVMAVPESIICQNISILILKRNFNLSDADKAILEDGGIIEMEINHQIISAGIDLNDETGIRMANGDVIAWRQDAKADSLPRYNFGLFGCWIADEDNTLSYVAEEDYDEKLLSEQKRAQSMHAAEAQLRQLKI